MKTVKINNKNILLAVILVGSSLNAHADGLGALGLLGVPVAIDAIKIAIDMQANQAEDDR
jgi:hypothetical protein